MPRLLPCARRKITKKKYSEVLCLVFVLVIYTLRTFVAFLIIHFCFFPNRTGVKEQYSEQNHLLTELTDECQSSLEKRSQSASDKKRDKDDLEMAKNMPQASLETYAKTKVTSDSDK